MLRCWPVNMLYGGNHTKYCRNSRSQVLYKIGILKNVAKFTGKHPHQSLSFNKVAGGFKSATLYIYIYFFSIRVFFHEHSRFTWQQGKGEAISLTPLYLFHLLNRCVDISRMIAKESSPLHIASTLTRNGNFRSERKSLTTNSPALCNCTENETPVWSDKDFSKMFR